MTLRTERLELVAASLEHIRAELSGPAVLATLLHAHVSGSWPPGEYDRDALEFFKSKLEEAPNGVGWYGWYVMSLGPDGSRQSVVAGAGFLGPPSPDGVVEIGYSVVPEERNKGYASEAVRALVDHALSQPSVQHLIAHTADSNAASSSVLIRSGFIRVGPGLEAGSSTYQRSRAQPPDPSL
jgi:[ribosomal protein S5]-alanine N-acetyltransferase